MTPSELKHYLIHGASTNGLANTLANGGICWWLIQDKGPVGWWGNSNFGGDLLATGFILPFIIALIVIPLHNKKVRSGSLNTVPADLVPRWMVWVLGMPQSLWLRGVLFGLIGVVGFALPTLGLLALLEVNTLTPAQYALFKGVWAGLVAFILVMPMTALAMNTAQADANNDRD